MLFGRLLVITIKELFILVLYGFKSLVVYLSHGVQGRRPATGKTDRAKVRAWQRESHKSLKRTEQNKNPVSSVSPLGGEKHSTK